MRYESLTQILYIGIVVLLVNSSCSVFAKSGPSEHLSQLTQEAIQNNPQIKAARERWSAAQLMISQSRSLADPKVNMAFIKMTGNASMEVDPRREQMIGISQEVPFLPKLYVRGKIATLEAQRAKEEYHTTQLAIISQLKKMYYDLYYVNQSIKIFQKNQKLLDEIEKSTRVNYTVGKGSQQDIYRAQTETSRLLMKILMLRQERSSMESDINRLLNRPLESSLLTPQKIHITPVTHDLNYFYKSVEQDAPQLKAQKTVVEKSKQESKLSKLDYFPDIDIGAGKLRDNAMHTQGYQVMLSATIPLYFASKQNFAVREKIARYNADVEDLYSRRRDLSYQIKNAFLLAQRSAKLINLIQHTIIPQAKLTLTSSQSTYSVGRVDFLTLLNNLLTLQDNELELQNEIVQHEKAIAQLEEITGVS